jgi:hypothetical protein
MTGSTGMRNLGVIDWGGSRDAELHRHYWVKFLIETDSSADGPQTVTWAPGLPLIGAPWTYGNDNDQYALCHPMIECETVVKREKNFHWILKYNFTTKPWLACLIGDAIENPVSQPDYIDGSFLNYQERTNKRRDGSATGTGLTGHTILSSSLEPIWLSADKNRPTVTIKQVRLNLELGMIAQMIDTLNDAPLWGLDSRCVKLRNVPWRRLVWGRCAFYFERTLQFDINYKSFDETEIRDQGHRWIDPEKLAADPDLDRTDPDNFTRAVDSRGNIQKIVLLNGEGEICSDPINHEHFIPKVELYDESNFLALGIPAVLQ